MAKRGISSSIGGLQTQGLALAHFSGGHPVSEIFCIATPAKPNGLTLSLLAHNWVS